MKKTFQSTDVAIIFAELQPAIVSSVKTVPLGDLVRTVGFAVETAESLRIPVLASGVGMPPDWSVEFIEPLKKLSPYVRTTTGMFDDEGILGAVAANGRRTIGIGGVSSEIAILHSVLGAVRLGFDVHVLVDCCGGLSLRTEAAAFRQMEAAGAIMSSCSSFFTALAPNLNDSIGQTVFSSLGRLWSWDMQG